MLCNMNLKSVCKHFQFPDAANERCNNFWPQDPLEWTWASKNSSQRREHLPVIVHSVYTHCPGQDKCKTFWHPLCRGLGSQAMWAHLCLPRHRLTCLEQPEMRTHHSLLFTAKSRSSMLGLLPPHIWLCSEHRPLHCIFLYYITMSSSFRFKHRMHIP